METVYTDNAGERAEVRELLYLTAVVQDAALPDASIEKQSCRTLCGHHHEPLTDEGYIPLCQPSGFSENRRKAGYDRLWPCVGLWLQGVCPDNALYIKDYLGYVCVHEIGDLIKPHYVTESFPKLLKAKGMRQIRYHDLRHSCASLLLANGVPMKQIQEWLGHSDFSTTANIYAHLDYSSKLTSADAMLNGLGFAQN